MRPSRWIFLISNTLVILMLILFYNHVNHTAKHSVVYPKRTQKTLFVDNHFNDEEFKIISEAAQEWTEKTHHLVIFNIEKLPSKKLLQLKKDILIIPVTCNFPDIVLSDHMFKNHNTLGYFNDEGEIYFIELVQERITDEQYKIVVLHELGHSLGLEHSDIFDGLNTLMYPAIQGGANHITDEDLKSFCFLYKCDYEKLKN